MKPRWLAILPNVRAQAVLAGDTVAAAVADMLDAVLALIAAEPRRRYVALAHYE